jgi:hypothetical protein
VPSAAVVAAGQAVVPIGNVGNRESIDMTKLNVAHGTGKASSHAETGQVAAGQSGGTEHSIRAAMAAAAGLRSHPQQRRQPGAVETTKFVPASRLPLRTIRR